MSPSPQDVRVVSADEETKANRGVFYSSAPNECTIEQGTTLLTPSHVLGSLDFFLFSPEFQCLLHRIIMFKHSFRLKFQSRFQDAMFKDLKRGEL